MPSRSIDLAENPPHDPEIYAPTCPCHNLNLSMTGGLKVSQLEVSYVFSIINDPILMTLSIGSVILYYCQLYDVMQRNKKKTGSYWKS
ncbi:MAG: hypothetical protein ABSF09_08470 [Candidatus Bathyarchaeia archaeon]